MQGGTALAYVPVLPRAEAFDPLDEDEKKIPPIQYTEKSLYLNKPYVVRVRRTLQDIANLQNAIKQGDYATVGDFAFIKNQTRPSPGPWSSGRGEPGNIKKDYQGSPARMTGGNCPLYLVQEGVESHLNEVMRPL
jgi:hypothetical protein